MTTLGERLREERKRLGLSQLSAGLLAGVSREAWNRYESGSMPNAEALVKLLAHGWDLNYCLGGSRSYNQGQVDADLLAECHAAVTEVLDSKGLAMPPKALAELVALIYESETTRRAVTPGAEGDVATTTAKILRLVNSK